MGAASALRLRTMHHVLQARDGSAVWRWKLGTSNVGCAMEFQIRMASRYSRMLFGLLRHYEYPWIMNLPLITYMCAVWVEY